MRYEATIRGARGDEWVEVIGTRTIPVSSPVPIRADLPGHRDALVYMVAVDQLAPALLGRIVQHISLKFKLPLVAVHAAVRKDGIPILAEDTTVAAIADRAAT